jgi:hypothetical protein
VTDFITKKTAESIIFLILALEKWIVIKYEKSKHGRSCLNREGKNSD